MTTDPIKTDADACLATLRETDRDRYLACLLSPPEKRDGLAALYAFHAEIARIRDLVREPLAGEIRLQWWRDLLEGDAKGDVAGNPIASGLMAAIERHRLPRQTLIALIEARTHDLYDDPIDDRNGFEGYAGETASALIQLSSLILSPEEAMRSAEAAGHAGVAQAIGGCLLLMPIHRRRQQVYVPLDILSAVGLDRDGFLVGEDRARISAAIEAFSGLGKEHLTRARRAGKVAKSVFPAFLPVSLTEIVLQRASRAGADVFERDIQSPQWRRQIRMLRALLTGRF